MDFTLKAAEHAIVERAAALARESLAPRAAFYVLPCVSLPPGHTDEDYVLALLRKTGILCVHGSGFGVAPEAGSG